MTRTELYLRKYRQLEDAIRKRYGIKDESPIAYYLEQIKDNKYYTDLNYCREVRNLLTHEPPIDSQFAVEPTQQMIDFIGNLIEKIKYRPKCSDIEIKRPQVFWKKMSGKVKPTIIKMREMLYTHIPILENGVVIGVFDENSIFNYLAAEEIIEVSDTLTFEMIKEHLSLNEREMEDFLFLKEGEYVDKLEKKFEESFRKGKRLGIVFLTKNGRSDEPLLGIITPWDILGAENKAT